MVREENEKISAKGRAAATAPLLEPVLDHRGRKSVLEGREVEAAWRLLRRNWKGRLRRVLRLRDILTEGAIRNRSNGSAEGDDQPAGEAADGCPARMSRFGRRNMIPRSDSAGAVGGQSRRHESNHQQVSGSVHQTPLRWNHRIDQYDA